MTDFASAAMIRVLAQGMRASGFDPGVLAHDAGGARVDLQQKQDLVRSAVAQGGLSCLPLLGRGLHRLSHEPTHQALASARSARDLFERWQRLERYIHSRHRCVIESCDSGKATIRHVALGDGRAPSAAEDLVVAGVLAALLEAIGLKDVRVLIGDAIVFPEPDPDGVERAAAHDMTAVWHYVWKASEDSARVNRTEEAVKELEPDSAWPEEARAAYLHLANDLTRPLALRELAMKLGVPMRTLQRRLGEAGLSYSELLAQARCRTGAWRLLHTADPIAEIGFLSGFADQSHFTREMQRCVGLPPAAYHTAFARVGQSVP